MKHRPLAALRDLAMHVFKGDPLLVEPVEFVSKVALLLEAGRSSVMGLLDGMPETFVFRDEVLSRVEKVDIVLGKLPKLVKDLERYDDALGKDSIDQYDAHIAIKRWVGVIDEIPVVWDKLMQVEAMFAG